MVEYTTKTGVAEYATKTGVAEYATKTDVDFNPLRLSIYVPYLSLFCGGRVYH